MIASHLRPELIRVAPPWTSFDETVGGLIETLVEGGALPAASAADAVRAVSERLGTLKTTALGLAIAGQGLYEAVPTVPIHIVALVLSPASANADHLGVLASMATLLRSAELRSALLTARNGIEAFALLLERA